MRKTKDVNVVQINPADFSPPKAPIEPATQAARNGTPPPPPPDVEVADEHDHDGEDMDGFLSSDQSEKPTAGDDFERLEDFALPQDFDPGVEEEDPPVGVHKPGPMDFFRVHPDPKMSSNVGILELRDERDDPYLVKQNMFPAFGKLVSRRRLFVCRSMQGELFLWPAKLSDGGGRNKYNETALKAAERAKTKWTRIQSDTTIKAHRIYGPGEPFPEPIWPQTTLLALMAKAFGDGYLIKDVHHPLVRRIKGLRKP